MLSRYYFKHTSTSTGQSLDSFLVSFVSYRKIFLSRLNFSDKVCNLY